MPHPLIEQFVDTLGQVRDHIDNGRHDNAHHQYLRLHSLYEQINQSELAHHHKKIAYDQITRIHSSLQDMGEKPPRRGYAPAIVVAGILFVVAGILFSVQPSILGFAVFDSTIAQPISLTFETSASHAVVLNGAPTSLKIDGMLTSGTAKVWMVTETGRTLVYDSTRALDPAGEFGPICAETCELENIGRVITLEVEVSGGKLYLDKVYYATDDSNSKPVWVGTKDAYQLKDMVSIDLGSLFVDEDEDRLVYLVTAAENVQASIQGSQVVFTRNGGSGERSVTLIATDLKDITSVPLTLELS